LFHLFSKIGDGWLIIRANYEVIQMRK